MLRHLSSTPPICLFLAIAPLAACATHPAPTFLIGANPPREPLTAARVSKSISNDGGEEKWGGKNEWKIPKYKIINLFNI